VRLASGAFYCVVRYFDDFVKPWLPLWAKRAGGQTVVWRMIFYEFIDLKSVVVYRICPLNWKSRGRKKEVLCVAGRAFFDLKPRALHGIAKRKHRHFRGSFAQWPLAVKQNHPFYRVVVYLTDIGSYFKFIFLLLLGSWLVLFITNFIKFDLQS